MAKNKVKRVTKPIGFRLEAGTSNAISEAAKAKGITIQEYFLSQIRPGSELDNILKNEQVRMMQQSENIAAVRDRMRQEAKGIQEAFGLSEDDFKVALSQSLSELLKPKK